MLSLSRPDPGLPSTAPGAVGKLEWGDASLAAPLAKASCGSQLDLIEVQEAEGMHMELEEDEPPSDPLTFEEDEEDVFVSTAKAEQPPAATVRPQWKRAEPCPLLPPAWACSTCVTVLLPSWTFPGTLL